MADIVLGGLGIASLISLFQTCNAAYDVFVRSARNLGKDYYHFSVLLEVERQKLRLWGQYLGISPTQQCRLLRAETLETQRTVVMLLESIKALLDDIGVIMVRYDVRIVQAGVGVGIGVSAGPGRGLDVVTNANANANANADNVNLDLDLQDMTLEDLRNCPAVQMAQVKRRVTERSVTRSTSRMGKIRWALSDCAKLKKLIEDLRIINEDLWVALPVNKWLALAKGLPSMILPDIHDREILNEVEVTARGNQTTKLLAACADLRRAALASSTAKNEANSSSFGDHLRLQDDCVKSSEILSSGDPKLAENRYLASVEGTHGTTRSVILEWRHVDTEFNFEQKQMLRSRIKAMAVLLSSPKSSEFGLLKCIGFFKDHRTAIERYGLLFEAPKLQAPTLEIPQPSRPCSLYEYIYKTRKDPPALGDRFRIASALCNVLLQIHASNWLHKEIRSSNILFLPDNSESSQSNLNISHPYLMGFKVSRPDRPTAESLETPRDPTDKFYRHPALWPPIPFGLAPRFRKEYDIFALGVVLVEVGNWKLVAQSCTHQDSTTREAWKAFLLKCVKPLGYKCGRIYQNVAEACLNGPFAENCSTGNELDPALDDLDIKRSFLFDVVYQLAKCYA